MQRFILFTLLFALLYINGIATMIYYTPIDFAFPAELYKMEWTKYLNIQYILLSKEPDIVIILKAARFALAPMSTNIFDVEIVVDDITHKIQIFGQRKGIYYDLPQHLFVLPNNTKKIIVSGIELNLSKQNNIVFTAKDVRGTHEPSMVVLNEAKQQSVRFEFGTKIFVVISAGEKPTGGYKVILDSVELSNDQITIKAHVISPKPTDMVTQAFSYPAVEIELSGLQRGYFKLKCVLIDQGYQHDFVEQIEIF